MSTKKYISLERLNQYDAKIKALIENSDEEILTSAKAYADGLATNYDAAGSAASALEEAKDYADGKDAAIEAAHKAGTDAATAASVADGKAVAVQNDVDALELYVGTIPTGATATDVVGYVIEKTTGIASEGAMTELGNRVTTVEGKVATIEGDYLKASDKTELEGKITAAETAAQTAVNTEKSRAEGIESGLRTDVDAIKGDYLKSTDKTELSNAITAETERATGVEGGLETRLAAVEADYLKSADKTTLNEAIALKADKTALEAEVERAEAAEESLQTQINTIMNNPDTEGVINSINEFTQYISDHGEIAEGFRTDIDANADAIEELKTYVGEIPTSSEFIILPETTFTFEDEYEVKKISLNVKDGWYNAFEDENRKYQTVVVTVDGVEYTHTPYSMAGSDLSVSVGESGHETSDGFMTISSFSVGKPDEIMYDGRDGETFPATVTVSIKHVEQGGTSATNVVDYVKEVVDAEAARATTEENKLNNRISVIEANIGEGSVDDKIAAAIAAVDAAYKAADASLKTELNAEIAKKADATALTEAVETLEGADAALAGRIEALEISSAAHALKTEVDAVSTALNEYKTAHAGDYTNAQIDAAIKVNADAIAAFVEAGEEDINAMFAQA